MHIVRQVQDGATIIIGRPAASVDLGAQPGLPRPARPRNGKSGHRVDNLSSYGAHFFRVVASAGSPEAL
jgi:hypothetical protein